MPTKWLQERHNGSKNDNGIGFEGPGVVIIDVLHREREFFIDNLLVGVHHID